MNGPNVATMRRLSHQHVKVRVVVESVFGRIQRRWNALRMIYTHAGVPVAVQEA